MTDKEIGGIPLGIRTFKRFFPVAKKARVNAVRPLSLILTYITYLVFSAARKPINVVRVKVLEDCNATKMAADPNGWCKGTVFEGDTDQITFYLGSLFIGAYAVSEFFSGVIADAFNPRYFITTGGIMAGFFSIVVGLANLWKIKSPHFFAMAVALLGAAHSTAWPVMLSCATHFYSSTLRRGLFFSLWNTHACIGGILGTFIATEFVEHAWGWSFLIPGLLVIVMSLVVFLFLVVHPADLDHLDERQKGIFETEDSDTEIPGWLNPSKSINYSEAFRIPGVIEFSSCMFFSRMTSYTIIYWYPVFHTAHRTASTTAYFSVWFAIGGVVGGVLTGFLKDLYRKGAIVCFVFLMVSIPVLALQILREEVHDLYLSAVLQFLLGIFVDGPFILLSTSVSVDLGTHSVIRRGHRGMATVASIVEGTGALGATLGPLISNFFMARGEWVGSLFLMMAMELVASLCLVRMVWKEYKEGTRQLSLGEYWS